MSRYTLELINSIKAVKPVLSSEPFPFKDEHAFEIGRFTHHAKTVFVDGEMFSWYGSRLLKAFDYFKRLHAKI